MKEQREKKRKKRIKNCFFPLSYQVELLTDLGMSDDLLEVTSRLTDLHPSSARLWLTRMRQEAKHDGKNIVEGVLNKALKLVPAEVRIF